jgi:hypothetical protein
MQVIAILFCVVSGVVSSMAIRALWFNAVASLRNATGSEVDCVVDSADNRFKYLGADGIVHNIVTDDLGAGAPISLTAASLTLVPGTHAGKTLVVNIASGSTITLPAATGSGARYYIFVGTTLTSGSLVVKVANANDFMRGEAYTFSGATASTFGTANTGTVSTESDTITFNRGTTGLGTIGDFIELIDLAANVWSLEADYASSGTAATPFTAAV